mgnify:FL=1
MGVFATRAPYRPNNIGLSSVKLISVDLNTSKGPVLTVGGVDMLDGTPIYDIKPYLPYVDSHENARGGFSDDVKAYIPVEDKDGILEYVPEAERDTIIKLLEQDPRPAYDVNRNRSYRMSYGIYDVEFIVDNNLIKVTNLTVGALDN